ncbi:IS1634 family transposase [Candidatus Gottesmanbacteria bacterium]|nr:IS1634 family transposase [Candidatus Gottesmanbacteria bacterium]
MFVRKQTVKGNTYISLVENRWHAVRRRHYQVKIASLGKHDDPAARDRAFRIASSLTAFCQHNGMSTLEGSTITLDPSSETFCPTGLDWGIREAAVHGLTRLGILGMLEQLHGRYTANVSLPSLSAATTAMIAHRLTNRSDASERSTHAWYTDHLFVPGKVPLTPMDFYQSLDVLIDHKDAIEQAYFEGNRDLFSQSLDLVLFDATSVYYWGKQDTASDEKDLLQYGFSKDGKGNLKQLIVGVLMTSSGVPIAHEVYPGNTADVSSFARIIKAVREKYKLEKVVLVADRGMVSEENLLILEEMGLGYIVGVRMRTLPGDMQTTLMAGLDPKEMEQVNDHLFTKQYHTANFSPEQIKTWFLDRILKGKRKNPLPTMDIKTIEAHVRNRRFFVFLNPLVERATKGKRAFFREIVKRKIAATPTKEWILKNGFKKYLQFPDGLHPTMDEERLESEELFDGKWVLVTNQQDIAPTKAGRYYQTLQRIERGFRDLKSLITIQPVFHYTEKRIKAHIFVCFLALIVKWYICRKINPQSLEDGRRFLEAMQELKAIEVDHAFPLYVRTELTQPVMQAMKQLGMKIPEKIIIDGRGKTTLQAKHSGGRPKTDMSTQTTLLDAV